VEVMVHAELRLHRVPQESQEVARLVVYADPVVVILVVRVDPLIQEAPVRVLLLDRLELRGHQDVQVDLANDLRQRALVL